MAFGFSAYSAVFNSAVFTPKLSCEAVFEATCQFPLTPYAQIQPDLQYVRIPGGGVGDPLNPARKMRDALVGGLRINVTFQNRPFE